MNRSKTFIAAVLAIAAIATFIFIVCNKAPTTRPTINKVQPHQYSGRELADATERAMNDPAILALESFLKEQGFKPRPDLAIGGVDTTLEGIIIPFEGIDSLHSAAIRFGQNVSTNTNVIADATLITIQGDEATAVIYQVDPKTNQILPTPADFNSWWRCFWNCISFLCGYSGRACMYLGPYYWGCVAAICGPTAWYCAFFGCHY